SRDRVLFRAMENARMPTSIAPPITSAREGSQGPARSRKPRTFSGFASPEISKPKPNSKPAANEAITDLMALNSQYVTDDKHGDKAGKHKTQCRHQRPGGKPG